MTATAAYNPAAPTLSHANKDTVITGVGGLHLTQNFALISKIDLFAVDASAGVYLLWVDSAGNTIRTYGPFQLRAGFPRGIDVPAWRFNYIDVVVFTGNDLVVTPIQP